MSERLLLEALEKAWRLAALPTCELSKTDDLDRWGFKQGYCHENARAYVQTHAGSDVIPCWIRTYVDGPWARHSVVRTADGRYVEVALRDFGRRFVPHDLVTEYCDKSFEKMPIQIPFYGSF